MANPPFLGRIPGVDGNIDLLLYVDPAKGTIIIRRDSLTPLRRGEDVVEIGQLGAQLLQKALLRAPWVKEPEQT